MSIVRRTLMLISDTMVTIIAGVDLGDSGGSLKPPNLKKLDIVISWLDLRMQEFPFLRTLIVKNFRKRTPPLPPRKGECLWYSVSETLISLKDCIHSSGVDCWLSQGWGYFVLEKILIPLFFSSLKSVNGFWRSKSKRECIPKALSI